MSSLPKWVREYPLYTIEIGSRIMVTRQGQEPYVFDEMGRCCCMGAMRGSCRHESMARLVWRYFICPQCRHRSNEKAFTIVTDAQKNTYLICPRCQTANGVSASDVLLIDALVKGVS